MTAPTLLSNPSSSTDTIIRMPAASQTARTLADLMYDGFYMLFLLRSRHAPPDAAGFVTRIRSFLDEFERDARKMGAATEDIFDAKYAFCATVDEKVLRSQLPIRALWERRPLQLAYFGDQLAGEHFFEKLESLRSRGSLRVQVMEVFYLCLLLGFEGRYALEGSEKLGYLTARVGDELAHHKGRRASFAPHWRAPDAIKHSLRGEVPLWAVASVFGLFAMLAFIGLHTYLDRSTAGSVLAYHQIVAQPPLTANLTITLP